jgi:hypothetical protein
MGAAAQHAGAPVLRGEQAELQVDLELDKVRRIGPVDFVVLSRPNKYYQKLGGKRYAPILDPVYEDMRARGKAVVLCEGPALDFECVNTPLTIDPAPHMSMRRRLPRPAFPGVMDKLQEVQSIVAAIEPDFRVEPDKIIFRYASHAHKREFYRKVFEILKPRIVFFSSFTSWVPVTWACREMGIPTVDIQHGGQSSNHGFNTHYSKVPREGYWMLPDFFWCWGFQNRAIIDRWFPGGAVRHIPFVGGNRWKAKWMGRKGLEALTDDERRFVVSLASRQPAILVTPSHGVEELLPKALIEAMQQTPSWLWLIRLHPINRSVDVQERIRGTLERSGISNFEMNYSTALPLHLLLQHVSYHVTPFSTAAREAVDLGVPTSIVDPIGRVDFAEDIAEGIFNYADTADAILEAIEQSLKNGHGASVQSFLETDEKYVDQALETIEKWRASVNDNRVRSWSTRGAERRPMTARE